MSDKSKQLSFVADKETLDLIKQLKADLKAPTSAAVFRKALTIAKIAADQAKASNGVVTLRGKSQPQTEEVSVALRA